MSYSISTAREEAEVELPFNREDERSKRARRLRNRSRNVQDFDDEDDGWN